MMPTPLPGPLPPTRRRRAQVFDLHLRDVSFGDVKTDPALTLEPSELIAKIWPATCRIVDYPGLQECRGTGFFTKGGAEGVVVVTNAHVVDSCTTVGIEWIEGYEIVSWPASLIAIDYTHDLAILRPTPINPFDKEAPTFPDGLEMGAPPHPGDGLWLAGYPHGVQTPRVARALASGYDIYQTYGCAVAAVMLDGNVNPGNSGGPVFRCQPNGRGGSCGA